mgnify:CR=1 FL=1
MDRNPLVHPGPRKVFFFIKSNYFRKKSEISLTGPPSSLVIICVGIERAIFVSFVLGFTMYILYIHLYETKRIQRT